MRISDHPLEVELTPGQANILLVEDELPLARAYARILKRHGLSPICVGDAASALGELRNKTYDVVISDIVLPDHSGLDLLRHVRNSDPDLPMVLVTGTPNLDTAIDAVALGAFRYLVKPISNDRLLGCIAQARRTRQVARLREEALGSRRAGPCDDQELGRAFDRALEPLWIAYQPIVSWPRRHIFGYQALVRSDEPSLALPSAILSAAEQLGRSRELSHAVWRSVAKTARALPEGKRVIIRSLVSDLRDEELYSSDSPLTGVANRVALDFAQSSELSSVQDLRSRADALRSLGYRLALSVGPDAPLDEEVAGRLAPRLVRFDATGASHAESLIEPTLEWCKGSGAELIVEGVEREREREAVRAVGCELFQDCLFTNPAKRVSRL